MRVFCDLTNFFLNWECPDPNAEVAAERRKASARGRVAHTTAGESPVLRTDGNVIAAIPSDQRFRRSGTWRR